MIKVEIIGYIGSNAEIKEATDKNGQKVQFVTFSVCANSSKESSEWFYCSSRSLVHLTNWLIKGQCVFAEGLLKSRIYRGRDGNDHVAYDLLVNSLQLVGKSPTSQQPTSQQSTPQQSESKEKQQTNEDLPF